MRWRFSWLVPTFFFYPQIDLQFSIIRRAPPRSNGLLKISAILEKTLEASSPASIASRTFSTSGSCVSGLNQTRVNREETKAEAFKDSSWQYKVEGRQKTL